MTGQFTSTPSTRLPIMDTVKASYDIALRRETWNMPLIWIPILLSIVFSWIGSMIPEATLDSAGGKPPDLKHMDPLQKRHMVEIFLLMPVQLLFLAALSISWMRHLIRGEKPSGAYLGSSLWRYIGYTIVFVLGIGLIAMAITIPLAFMMMPHVKGAQPSAASLIILVPLMLALALVIIWFVTRCVLKFVAVGVDDKAMTLRRSAALMKGNVWPWIGGTFVLIIPLMLASAILGLIGKHILGDSLLSTLLLGGLFNGLLSVLQILLTASFYGLAYRHIVTGQQRSIVA